MSNDNVPGPKRPLRSPNPFASSRSHNSASTLHSTSQNGQQEQQAHIPVVRSTRDPKPRQTSIRRIQQQGQSVFSSVRKLFAQSPSSTKRPTLVSSPLRPSRVTHSRTYYTKSPGIAPKNSNSVSVNPIPIISGTAPVGLRRQMSNRQQKQMRRGTTATGGSNNYQMDDDQYNDNDQASDEGETVLLGHVSDNEPRFPTRGKSNVMFEGSGSGREPQPETLGSYVKKKMASPINSATVSKSRASPALKMLAPNVGSNGRNIKSYADERRKTAASVQSLIVHFDVLAKNSKHEDSNRKGSRKLSKRLIGKSFQDESGFGMHDGPGTANDDTKSVHTEASHATQLIMKFGGKDDELANSGPLKEKFRENLKAFNYGKGIVSIATQLNAQNFVNKRRTVKRERQSVLRNKAVGNNGRNESMAASADDSTLPRGGASALTAAMTNNERGPVPSIPMVNINMNDSFLFRGPGRKAKLATAQFNKNTGKIVVDPKKNIQEVEVVDLDDDDDGSSLFGAVNKVEFGDKINAGDIIIEGLIERQKENQLKTWLNSYCVLTKFGFYYFASVDDFKANKVPFGKVKFLDLVTFQDKDRKGGLAAKSFEPAEVMSFLGRPYIFQIQTENSMFMFAAKTKDRLQDWTNRINDAYERFIFEQAKESAKDNGAWDIMSALNLGAQNMSSVYLRGDTVKAPRNSHEDLEFSDIIRPPKQAGYDPDDDLLLEAEQPKFSLEEQEEALLESLADELIELKNMERLHVVFAAWKTYVLYVKTQRAKQSLLAAARPISNKVAKGKQTRIPIGNIGLNHSSKHIIVPATRIDRLHKRVSVRKAPNNGNRTLSGSQLLPEIEASEVDVDKSVSVLLPPSAQIRKINARRMSKMNPVALNKLMEENEVMESTGANGFYRPTSVIVKRNQNQNGAIGKATSQGQQSNDPSIISMPLDHADE